MNIEKFFTKNPEDKKYANSFRRTTAAAIDIWIVLFLRVVVIQILGSLWMNQQVINFMLEFQEKFGTETVKNTPEHINFVIHHKVFIYALTFYAIVILIGAVYHAYLNSSAWCGTVGKRLMKIIIITENGLKITLKRGMLHYFLSILPFAFLIYLISFQLKNQITVFQALTYSETNIFLGIVFIAWIQIHLFTKKRTTAYDMICNTILVNGKMNAKFPWHKNK